MRRALWRLFAPVVIALALAIALAPFLYLGASDADEVAKGMTLSPAERLAVVSMHRVGLVRLMEPEEGGPDDPWSFVDTGAVARCGRTPLAIGIATAESYARPAWRRDLELSIARLWRDISGNWPDWSYGIGQIRLSTARVAVTAAAMRYMGPDGPLLPAMPDDDALMALLADPCDNLFLARLVLDLEVAPGKSDKEAARLYRGGDEPAGLLAGVGYKDLVARVAAAIRVLGDGGIPVQVALKGGYSEETEIPSLHLVERFADGDGPVPIVCFRRAKLDAGGPAVPYAVFPVPDPSLGDSPERQFDVDPMTRPAGGSFAGVIPEGATLAVTLVEDEPGDLALLAAAADAARGLAASGLDVTGPWQRVTFAAASDTPPYDGCEVVVSVMPPPEAFFAAWGPVLEAAINASREGQENSEGGFAPSDEPSTQEP
ncbi:hypothetical protein [Paracoccus sp. PAR01]|uniref:hypothetical protein n=1 Tax=Paracoccus sp. PAR01 TaxID=2769282 RepID=UPI0017803561|nr:hypothetical protein [Paracoccus sp. PAR01]MBD9527105.1 hypothetical protein [Paracoccus sp. PAR01]